MNDPTPGRTPYCHKIRYGVTGAPTLDGDDMDGSHAPAVGVIPKLIELVYSPARDGKPARVDASVTGDWTRFGEPDDFGGQVTTHFKNGPDAWPAWLAEEARLHDPERAASAPAVWIDGHPQLEAIAAAVWERCRTEDTSTVVDDSRNIAVAALAAIMAVLPAGSEDTTTTRAAVERVLALHKPIAGDGGPYCETCTQEERQPQPVGWWVPWPCPTVQALDELRRLAAETQPSELPRPHPAVDALAAVLALFPTDLNPAGPAVQSRHAPAELIQRWRQAAASAGVQTDEETSR